MRPIALDPALIHVVYGHGGERVRTAVRAPNLRWVLQAEQLGTGHAVQQAMPGVPDNHLVLVLYGDVPLIRPETLRALLERAGAEEPGSAHGKIRGRRPATAASCATPAARCSGSSSSTMPTPRSAGSARATPACSRCRATLLKRWLGKLQNRNAQREYYLTDIIAMAVKDKIKVAPLVAPTTVEVLGVNDKLQLAGAGERVPAAARARTHAVGCHGDRSGQRIDVRGAVSCGRDVVLDVNVLLEGPVQLGDGVRVGANCVLSQVKVGAGTQHQAQLRHRARRDRRRLPDRTVQPHPARIHVARRRAHRQLRRGQEHRDRHRQQGQPPELPRRRDVGAGVNVGAGTITCNYDGANKWRTDIGDQAFIGSGVMLVAPVRIGEGATIGAGSTITHDAPGRQAHPGAFRPARRRALATAAQEIAGRRRVRRMCGIVGALPSAISCRC